jgi:hypothetical protein
MSVGCCRPFAALRSCYDEMSPVLSQDAPKKRHITQTADLFFFETRSDRGKVEAVTLAAVLGYLACGVAVASGTEGVVEGGGAGTAGGGAPTAGTGCTSIASLTGFSPSTDWTFASCRRV